MLRRALVASGVGIVLYAACGTPEDSGLYQPFSPNAGLAGAGGSGMSQSPLEQTPALVSDASISEAMGGALGFAGASNPGVSGETAIVDAGPSDAGDAAALADAAGEPQCADNTERCDGIDNDCDGQVDEGNACAATCAGFALEGRGYMFCSDSVVRDDAADRCEGQGMRLAWIETPEENAALVARIEAADVPASASEEILTYIGGSDSGNEGNWIWRGRGVIADGFQFWQGTSAASGGQAVGGAYANWSPTEPNNTDQDENCTVISVLGNNNREPGNWDDRDCDSPLPFVCEVP